MSKKYEYKREFVSRIYNNPDMRGRCPETDCLEKEGEEGWLLCAVGTPDSVGTKILYFCKEI